MDLRVLIFGPLADAAGAATMVVRVRDGATVQEIHEAIARAHPGLAVLLIACRLAVNGAFVPTDRAVTRDDELALIGLVSGG